MDKDVLSALKAELKSLFSIPTCADRAADFTVVLPLMFEGKFVGNAGVPETYDPPQTSNDER